MELPHTNLDRRRKPRSSEAVQEGLEATIRYFKNNIAEQRMDYAHHIENNLPIGSGVIEAACKTLVKQRLAVRACAGNHEALKSF